MISLPYNQVIYLIHILFVAPLFIYIGYYKDKTHPKLFDFLIALGATVFVYHLYQFLALED